MEQHRMLFISIAAIAQKLAASTCYSTHVDFDNIIQQWIHHSHEKDPSEKRSGVFQIEIQIIPFY